MRSKLSYLVAVAVLTTGIVAGSALAGSNAGGNGAPCGSSPVFAAYGDTLDYIPTQQIIGGEEFAVTSNVRVSTAGGAAVFRPASCIGKLEPVIRFWAQNLGGPSSTLAVTVDYKDRSGVIHHQALGTLSGYAGWQPTPILVFDAAKVYSNIKISLTPNGTGADWLVSDVYFDPRKSH